MTGNGKDSITVSIAYGSIIFLAGNGFIQLFLQILAFYFSTVGVYYGAEITPAVPCIGNIYHKLITKYCSVCFDNPDNLLFTQDWL